MDSSFIFRTGKYAGKTYGWVEDYAPDYLIWVRENRPEMLVDKKKVSKPIAPKEVVINDSDYKLKNNMNFDNESPSDFVIEYKKKQKENDNK